MFEEEPVRRVDEGVVPLSGSVMPGMGDPGSLEPQALVAAAASRADSAADAVDCCALAATGGVCDHMVAVVERAREIDRVALKAEEVALAALEPAELAALATEGYPLAVAMLDTDDEPDGDQDGGWAIDAARGWEAPAGRSGQGPVGEHGLGVPVDVLAVLDPGAALAGELDGLDLTSLDEYALVEVLAAARRVESWAAGLTAKAAAELARAEVFDPARFGSLDPETMAVPEEISMRLGVTRGHAKKLITVGQGLRGSFTATGEALDSGVIDFDKAATIVTTLRGRPDVVAWLVEQEVLERAGRRTHSQLPRDLAKAIIAVDAEDAVAAHRRANRTRHVTHPRPLPDGMASMYVVGAAQDLVGVDLVLDAVAAAAKATGDDRTRDQLRADTLFTMASGALETGWAGPQPQAAHTHDGQSREAAGGATTSSTASTSSTAAAAADAVGDLRAADGDGAVEADGGLPRAPTRPDGPTSLRSGASDDTSLPSPDTPESDGTVACAPGGTGTGVPGPGRPGVAASPDAAEYPDRQTPADVPRDVPAGKPGCEAGGHCGCGRGGVAAELGVLPDLLRRLRRRRGMRVGDPRTNRTEVRITVPLSVVIPPPDAGAAATHQGGAPTGGADSTEYEAARSAGAGGAAAADSSTPDEQWWVGPEPSEVAELNGYGPIAPDVARALAAGGTWRRIVTDPFSGAVLDVGRRRYRPPADLASFIRERDKTCIRPACSTPATRCQLDHTVPASQGGETSEANLGPLCERDHGIKTNGQAKVTQPSPGVFEWRTPTGHAYRRNIDGTVTSLPRGYLDDAPF